MTKDVQTLLRKISTVSKNFTYQLLRDSKMKIQPNDVERYKKIKIILDELKIFRYTYKLPEEKTFRIALRNLCNITDYKDRTNEC